MITNRRTTAEAPTLPKPITRSQTNPERRTQLYVLTITTPHDCSTVFIFCTAKMAFNAMRHASMMRQQTMELMKANCETPRVGDRTRQGEQGSNIISCCAHMQPPSTTQAQFLYDNFPQNLKDAPGNVENATAIAILANNASRTVTQGCSDLLPPGGLPDAGITFYMSAGSYIFANRQDSTKLIAFVWENMDDRYRVPWPDLTGREQAEWLEAWERSNRNYQRREQLTRGLRGTDLARLQDRDSVTEAMRTTPSLSRRRPIGHVVPEDDWNEAARDAGVMHHLF